MRRRGCTLAGLILAGALLGAPAGGAPQNESQAPPAKPEAQAVEQILREQEEVLRGQGFSYDPQGRRDPFQSLWERVPVRPGPRPKGIAGMLVSEIDLVGVVRDPSGGDVAFVIGSDNKGYFLRAGDQVYDATVIAVDPSAGAVTFRQYVEDPRLIKPYRDVVKRLAPLEEMGNE